MDDDLQKPTSELKPLNADEENNSEDEEERPDWLKLIPQSQRPVIPKRGEKAHEPTGQHGKETNLQAHLLQRARNAMFDAIRTPLSAWNKTVSAGEWIPDERRVKVTYARGGHFQSLGWKNWILPEEALYLVERGSLICTTPAGAPMSVQQAYSTMIGEELTLEAFQVYAYLKRLGYILTRFDPPFSDYPVVPLTPARPPPSGPSLLDRVKRIFISIFAPLLPSYASLFRTMRSRVVAPLTPTSLRLPPPPSTTPYTPLWNLYKPQNNTPFKKSSPGPAPWQLVVINARTTPMPTLQELTALFDIAPPSEIPPPKIPPKLRPAPKFQWFKPQTWFAKPSLPPRNPFVGLRAGKKTAVIAVVDTGNVGFFRFMQGAFEEVEMHANDI
ncbi:hypothetical protein CYLTODRAFT_486032 [Cylindrobasidium torrendii FP15055 ss-10]|uniref:tRNA-splicing endonuclease subunit Sen54 N-terminal domain-containing protein n=1 Tax=Cylindrobasidium torrendii FP15055 ss-10 TaxID=1314674 RepID=A0A0D7BQI4_9AGAR|nr:hypothetical protein CYLTODRAFT_486032 [Cylindrobasidium torrendii FP15055 ss-10]